MGSGAQKKSGALIRRLFEVLADEPEGLTIREAVDRLEQSTYDSLNGTLVEQVLRGCIAPIKAGWLVNRGYYLKLSPAGRQAYEEFKDPAEFIRAAGRHSVRAWLSVYFPRSYYSASKAKDRLAAEVRATRRIGFRHLFRKAVGAAASWQKVLPLQLPRRIEIAEPLLSSAASLTSHLESLGVKFSEGGHAIYLDPTSLAQGPFKPITQYYPANVGIKIIKESGGIYESGYIHEITKGDSRLHLRLVHNPRHLTLVANLLFHYGVGPRLFDLAEIQCDEKVWTAYVMEHVGSGVPSMSICQEGIDRLKQLEEQGLLKVALPEGFNDEEFQCPSCANNVLQTEQGGFRYIDFQNFVLPRYDQFLKQVALEATEASHFGDKSLLRGGRYLYQSVPGVDLPGKRSIEERVKILGGLFEAAGMDVKDRLVLDVGCNIGMMMGQYLSRGALWCHGWDRAFVTPHTERLLYALGCTRFSTTGSDITKQQALDAQIPEFLAPFLNGCVISYLAVRAHIGWLDALARIPWSFLIYEGHEGESREDFEEYMQQFRSLVEFKVSQVTEYCDGDSDERTLAILSRV